jgi:hypothetical protein
MEGPNGLCGRCVELQRAGNRCRSVAKLDDAVRGTTVIGKHPDDVYLSIDVVKDGERQSCQRNQLSTSLRT